MSQRTDIINSLIVHLATETQSRGFRGYRFMHEVNDFPSFYVAFQNERRVHKGAGMQLGVISFSLRGYTWSDNLDSSEDYLRALETAIQTFKSSFVQEARTLEVRTDEGIMAPYGIVDISLEVLYILDR